MKFAKMTIIISRAKKLARSLLRENRKNGRTWRAIAHEDYNDQINFATLNRFAKSKGAWIPKDNEILITLGLKKPCKPHEVRPPLTEHEKQLKTKISDMAKKTREAILKSTFNNNNHHSNEDHK